LGTPFSQLLEELWETPDRLWQKLQSVIERSSWLERSELIQALKERGPSPALVDRFLKILEEEGDVPIKTFALDLLQRWGPRIESSLKRALNDPSYRGKKFLAEIVATLPSPQNFARELLAQVKDPDPNIRVSALEAIRFPLKVEELRFLMERFSREGEPIVQFAYLDLFLRLLKMEVPSIREEVSRIIPETTPPGYLLAGWLRLLPFYPPEVAGSIVTRWERIFTSPHLLEELIRWLVDLPPTFQISFLRSLRATLPHTVFHDLNQRISSPDLFGGEVLLVSALAPQHLPLLFRSGTLPSLELFQRVVGLVPRDLLLPIYDLLSSFPSLQARKLFLYLGAFLQISQDEAEWIRMWERYPQLRPWIFRYGAELDFVWVLNGLGELFTISEEEFPLILEGLRVFTYRDRERIVRLFSPLVERIHLTREWVRALEVIEKLGLVELRAFVERAFRRAEPQVRAQALELMSEFYFEEVHPYLRLGLSDESLIVRLKALEIWEKIATEGDLSEISALLHDPLPWVQVRAVGILVRLQRIGTQELLSFLREGNPSIKSFVLHLLTRMRERIPSDLLEKLLQDPHPMVVAEAIRYIEECERDRLSEVKGFLLDPRFPVRAQATLSLLRGGGPRISQSEGVDPELLSYFGSPVGKNEVLTKSETPEERLYLRLIFEDIYEVSGLRSSPDQYPTFRYRLEEVRKRHRFRDFQEFYFFLSFHPFRDELLLECIEAISTGETYFYREVSSLEFFFDLLYPKLKGERRGFPIRLYSIGCSTGEEPYTLAILARERGISPQEIHIIGTDIHRGAIERAREGLYRARSLDTLPLFLRNKYFQKVGGEYRISEDLRPYVTFIHWNLLDHTRLPLLPPADAIFCRNLLIYFDQQSRERALRSFERLLKPGGVLILGHAENLLHVPTSLQLMTEEKEFYYQKPKEIYSSP